MDRAALCLSALLIAACAGSPPAGRPAGASPEAAPRVATAPYLRMPETAQGTMPPLLSQTGAFADLQSLTPAKGLLPYDLVVPFWSDGAGKSRLVAIPAGKVGFSPTGEWTFPPGTVFVKTFELPVDAAQPRQTRRLETRLLVVGAGAVYGVTYRWRPDLSDAELLPSAGQEEDIAIRDAGGTHVQTWVYPSREDCLVCHNAHTPGVLGPKTRQMNRELRYPDGISENQLRRWNRLGLFSPALDEESIASLPTLARAQDTARSIEDRARSWLDANCAHCHRPGGTVAGFDARYDTPLSRQNLIDGPVLIDQGVDRARVISPHDPWRSIALLRVDTNEDLRMPPLARRTIDHEGAALLREWILGLPGRDVLPPPVIHPAGGTYGQPVTVTLSAAGEGVEIHYTVDGSAPGPQDARYEGPIRIEGPTVLRARAYQDGKMRSVIAQQTYLVGAP